MTRLTSCRVCGKVCQGGLCPEHQAAADKAKWAKQRKPSPSRRGYGTAYRTARAELARQLAKDWARAGCEAQPANRDLRVWPCDSHFPHPRCVLCGLVIHNGEPWTAEHITPLARGGSATAPVLGPAHPTCNYRAGGGLRRDSR